MAEAVSIGMEGRKRDGAPCDSLAEQKENILFPQSGSGADAGEQFPSENKEEVT